MKSNKDRNEENNKVIRRLFDTHKKTVGATVEINGKKHDYSTSAMKELYNKGVKFSNAIIDRRGFVRAKNGMLDTSMILNNRLMKQTTIEEDALHLFISSGTGRHAYTKKMW